MPACAARGDKPARSARSASLSTSGAGWREVTPAPGEFAQLQRDPRPGPPAAGAFDPGRRRRGTRWSRGRRRANASRGERVRVAARPDSDPARFQHEIVFHLGERGAVSLPDGGDFAPARRRVRPARVAVGRCFPPRHRAAGGSEWPGVGRVGGMGKRQSMDGVAVTAQGICERAGEGMAEALFVKAEEALPRVTRTWSRCFLFDGLIFDAVKSPLSIK